MAVGSIQPLTDMNTRKYFLAGKAGQYLGLTTIPLSYANCLETLEPVTSEALKNCPKIALFLSCAIPNVCSFVHPVN